MYTEDYFHVTDVMPYDYIDEFYMDELWAYIPEFYREYMISNKGRVYSCRNHQLLRVKKMDRHGHLGVCLCSGGKRYYKYLHRLMADAFIPNPNSYPVVRYLNDKPYINELENLAWGTHYDNSMDSIRNGNARFPTAEAREKSYEKSRTPIIATNLSTGEEIYFIGQGDAGRVLNIQQANIWKVLNGERTHAGGYQFRYANRGEKHEF